MMELLDLFVCVCVCVRVCACKCVCISEWKHCIFFQNAFCISKVCKAENLLRERGTTGRLFCEEIRD